MFDYHAPDNLLQDSVILVTGASDGIGREAALTYARHGAQLILLGRSQAKLEAVQEQIVQAKGLLPTVIALDFAQATVQQYQRIAATITEQFSHLDGLLHSAGVLGSLSPFEQIQLDEWQQLLQVNVTAQMQLTQALLPLLKVAPQGRIIFTSSGVGKKARALWAGYAVSKFATEGMMQLLADEFASSSLRINCINPGATRTAMRAQACPTEDPGILKTPAELMPLYLYLMGRDSQQVNGQSWDAQPKRNTSGAAK